jgi:hypothetical protein
MNEEQKVEQTPAEEDEDIEVEEEVGEGDMYD